MTSSRFRRAAFSMGLVLALGVEIEARAQAPDAPAATARSRHGRRPSARASVTRHGFEPRDDGSTRFFVRTTGPVEPTSHASRRRFEVLLRSTNVPVRNERRPLETRFFNTPVLRMRLEPRGHGDLAVIFDLRADVTPNVRVEAADGGSVLYVEFPAGQYLSERQQAELRTEGGGAGVNPPPRATLRDEGGGTATVTPSREPPPAPEEQPVPIAPGLTGSDDERPPAMRGR